MVGFELVRTNGSAVTLGATDDEVADDGSIAVFAESLTTAVLERVDLDAGDSGDRREADAVRDIIRRHFHLRPQRPRRR